MDHMQILHECKDCQADHFRQQRSRHRNLNISLEFQESRVSEQDRVAGFIDEHNVFHHIQAVDDCHPQSRENINKNVLPCLLHAERSGIFCDAKADNAGVASSVDEPNCTPTESATLETEWEQSYADRQLHNKQKHCLRPQDTPEIIRINPISSIQDGETLRNSDQPEEHETVRFANGIDMVEPEQAIDMAKVIRNWELNKEQERAFWIIVLQSLNVHDDPLHMFLGGAAGTGKSRVISAV